MELRLLRLLPKKIQGKVVNKYELESYFGDISVYELVNKLRYGQAENYFAVDFIVNNSNKSASDYAKLMSRSSLAEPFTGALNPNPTALPLPAFIKLGVPLSGRDTDIVLNTLTEDRLDEELRFTISNINHDKIIEITQPKTPKKSGQLQYNGLVVDEDRVSYLKHPIHLTPQERELLRFLLLNKERLIFKDELLKERDILDESKFKNPHMRLSQLISALRVKLEEVIHKDCIPNSPNEGWRFEIK